MFCSQCGAQLDPNARFCGQCGTPTALPDPTPQPVAQPEPTAPVDNSSQSNQPFESTIVNAEVPTEQTQVFNPQSTDYQPVQQQAAPVNPAPVNNASAGTGAAQNLNESVSQVVAVARRSEVFAEKRIKGMAIAAGIGLAAAAVFAALQFILFSFLGSSQTSEILSELPYMSSSVPDNLTSFVGPLSIFGILLTGGVGGSVSVSGGAQGISVAGAVNILFPISLSGVALILGVAFGAYMFGKGLERTKKWTHLWSAMLTGLAVAIAYLLIAFVTAIRLDSGNTAIGGALSSLGASVSITISAATFGTFAMAFIFATLGAWFGFVLAEKHATEKTIVQAAWKWTHQARGFVRTIVESSAVYAVVFTVVAIGLLIYLGVKTHSMMPLSLLSILPLLAAYAQALSSFGSLRASMGGTSGSNNGGQNFTLAKLAETVSPWLWGLLVLFIVASVYIVLRMIVRNMYDAEYAQWKYAWQAPTTLGLVWIALALFGLRISINAGAMGYGYNVSVGIELWYGVLFAVWLGLLEVASRVLNGVLYPLITVLWSAVVGGTVAVAAEQNEQPAQPVQAETAPVVSETVLDVEETASTADPVAFAQQPTEVLPSSPVEQDPTVVMPVQNTSMLNEASTVSMAAPAPQPVASNTAPAPVAKPLDPQKKRVLVISAIVIAVLAVLFGAYSIASSTLFGPKNVVNQYVKAVESGNYTQATKLSNLGLSTAQSALLTSTAGKNAEVRISGATVGKSVKNPDGSQTFNVSYNFQNSSQTASVTVKPVGKQFGIFDKWTVTNGLTQTVNVTFAKPFTSVSISGVAVGKANALSEIDYGYTFAIYPGVYSAQAKGTKYIKEFTGKIGANSDLSVTANPTDALEEDINAQVKSVLDECAKSTSPEPEGCPFSSWVSGDSDSYSDLSWSITKYPVIRSIDLEDGSFSFGGGTATLKYRHKDFFDDWTDDSDDNTIYGDGTFTLDGNKLTVKFDNSSW